MVEKQVPQFLSVSFSVMPDSFQPGLQPTSFSVHGFSRQGYWTWLPFPSTGDPHDPGLKSKSPALQADSLLTELSGKTQKSKDTS